MKGEWEINKRDADIPNEKIDDYSLADLVDAIHGLMQAQLINLPLTDAQLSELIRDKAEPLVTIDGKLDGTWSLALEKDYGAMLMTWRLTTVVDSEKRVRVTARLNGVIKRGEIIFDPLDGYQGVICRVEVGVSGEILAGTVGFGTGGINRDLVTLNYLSSENPPERVVICRGGLDGRMIDSAAQPDSYRGLSVSFGTTFYAAHDLLSVPFAQACQLVSEVTENSRIDSGNEFLFVLSCWWEQFGRRQNSPLMPL